MKLRLYLLVLGLLGLMLITGCSEQGAELTETNKTIEQKQTDTLKERPEKPSRGSEFPQDRQFPAEMTEICSDKSIGDSCTFSGPSGSVEGTCQEFMDTVACVPENMPSIR